jgi:hypothetical protein
MSGEKDGQIDAEGVWGMEEFLKYKNKVLSLIKECGEKNGEWMVPVLKLRTKGQFCLAKNLEYGKWSKE